MSVGVANSSKAGLCPHGLPMGACPICSGGGGGVRMDRNTRRNASELTWNECYAIGQMMKAAQARKDMAEMHQQNVALQNAQILAAANRFAQAFNAISTFLSNSPLAQGLRTVSALTNNIATKTANIVSNTLSNIANKISTFTTNIATFAQNIANNIKNKIIDISDKIAAFFGEEKLSEFKKLNEFIERAKKKTLSLLGFVHETAEEEETTEEVKKEEKKISFLLQVNRKLSLIEEEGAENDG